MENAAENHIDEPAVASERPAIKTLFGMPEGHDARVLADKARELMPADRVLVHVALDDTRVATMQELLAFFAPDVEICVFPAWDCLPYDRVSPHSDVVAHRVGALAQLMTWHDQSQRAPRIVLTTVNAVTQRVMPQDVLRASVFTAQRGSIITQPELQSFFQSNGYMRTDTVREAGESAIQ